MLARRSPAPPVRHALVPAAARLSTPDSYTNPKQLIRLDGTPIIIHLLRSLHAAGIERVVITLGYAARQLRAEVAKEAYGSMLVEFVVLQECSWKRGHASNILAARSMFPTAEPFLIVMSDHLFDRRLISNLTMYSLPPNADAAALVDDNPELVDWSQRDHCTIYCKNGHCHSLVKVLKGSDGRISRLGKKLSSFDALEAGAYVVRPVIFDALRSLLERAMYCTLADAMQLLASEGRLQYTPTQGLEWFSDQTVASLASPFASPAVPISWREGAISLLSSQGLSVPSPSLRSTTAPDQNVPCYDLGDTIGEGGSSVVVRAEVGALPVSPSQAKTANPASAGNGGSGAVRSQPRSNRPMGAEEPRFRNPGSSAPQGPSVLGEKRPCCRSSTSTEGLGALHRRHRPMSPEADQALLHSPPPLPSMQLMSSPPTVPASSPVAPSLSFSNSASQGHTEPNCGRSQATAALASTCGDAVRRSAAASCPSRDEALDTAACIVGHERRADNDLWKSDEETVGAGGGDTYSGRAGGDSLGCGEACSIGREDESRTLVHRTPSHGAMQQRLAVKVIKRGGGGAPANNHASNCWVPTDDEVMMEVHILRQLHHRHIVRVMDVIDVVDATYIVMECVDGPELTEYAAGYPNRILPSMTACCIFTQILSALRYAHSQGFVHCDIKPQNVRLSAACDRAVLTDWGLARRVGSKPEMCMHGTPAYAPPERLTGYCRDSVSGRRMLCPASDVWSLGVLLYEMLTGKLPFRGESFCELVREVTMCRFEVPESVPRAAAELIHGMLCDSPDDRMTVRELAESPWVIEGGFLEGCDDDTEGGMSAFGKSGWRGSSGELSGCGECDVESVPLLNGSRVASVSKVAGRLLGGSSQRRTTLLRALAATIYALACMYGIYRHIKDQPPSLPHGA